MKLPLWLRNPIGRRTKSHKRSLPRPRGPRTRLLLEALEARLAPAVRTWDGGGANDLWSNPVNWDGDLAAPTNGDDVRIAATSASAEVNLDVSVTLNSLSSDGINPVGQPFRIPSTTLTLSGAGPFVLGEFTLDRGTLNAVSATTLAGPSTWSSGTINGTVTNAGTLNLTQGGGAHVLGGGANTTFTNAGIFTNASGAVFYLDGPGTTATFNNQAGGSFDEQEDVNIVQNSGTGTAVFNNQAGATFKKIASVGTSNIGPGVTFTNDGTVQVQTGTLDINGPFANFDATTRTLTGGTYLVTGTLRFAGANIGTNAATIVLDGLNAAIRNSANNADALAGFDVNAAGGSFTLQNGRVFNLAANFSNAGTVQAESQSVVIPATSYTQTAGTTSLSGGSLGAPAGLNFNGTSTYVSVPTSASLNPTAQVTIEAWIKPTTSNNPENGIAGTWTDPNSYSYLLWTLSNKASFYLAHPGGSYSSTIGTTTLQAGQWYHLTGTFDGTNIRLYVNGILEATTLSPGTVATNTQPFLIGRQDAGGFVPTFFNGTIGDVRLWNVALSQAAIQANQGKVLAGNETGLVADWLLNESTGTMVRDRTANQNDGMRVNNPTFGAPTAVSLQGGLLTGSGTVLANVANAATVSPGSSPGLLTVSGDYTQASGGGLNVEIGGLAAGTQFDQLNVIGAASLAGTLNVTLINGFVPAAPDRFRVLNAGARTGTFATLNGLLFPGGRFVPFYDAGGVILDANLAPMAMMDTDTTLEDMGVTTNVVMNDSDPDGDLLTVVAVTQPPAGQGMVVNNGNGTITYVPAFNFNGATSYTYTIRDVAGNEATGTVSITVSAVNDPPFFNPIANQSVPQNSPPQMVAITNVNSGGGADESGQTVTLTATSDNPGLVPNPGISGTGSMRTLTYAPVMGMTGSAVITVTADDGQAQNRFFSRMFTIIVTAAGNQPPVVVNPIADLTVNEDAAPVLGYANLNQVFDDPNDPDSALTYTITANTPAGIVTVTIEPNATLDLSFVMNQNGVVDITVQATDPGNLSARDTFRVTVSAVNDPPVFDAIANQTVSEDAPAQMVSITGVGPGGGSDEQGQTVTLTAVSSNAAIVPNPTITGMGPTRTLTYRPAANANGMVTITVTANDSQVQNNLFPRMFTITVNAVNDAPVNTVPGPQTTTQNTSLNFGSTISVADVDANINPVEVQLGVSNGTLTLSTTNGLTFTNGGNGTASMTFTGTLTAINTALNGLVYRPVMGYTGPDQLTITTNDQGNTGTGGPLRDSDTVAITVVAAGAVTFRFDLKTAGTPTPGGYLSVRGSDVYNPVRGFGWQTAAGEFDRPGQTNPLLRDGHWGGALNTFNVDVPNGLYRVTLTQGDQQWARDRDEVLAEGSVVLNDVASAAGQFFHRTFSVTVNDRQLNLGFRNAGGDPYWVVNAIEVRSVQGPITFDPDPAGPFSADGTTVTTFTGRGATPNSLVTLTTTLGTLVSTDRSAAYGGVQVLTDASGAFAFAVRPGFAAGTATFTAEEVTGATFGTATRDYELLAQRSFDFNGPANATEAGFIGVRGADLFTAARGYGWLAAAPEFDRGTASAPPVAVNRDGHWGTVNTFRVQVKPGVAYNVEVFVGDQQWARDNIRIRANGSAAPDHNVIVPSTRAGAFATATLTSIVSPGGVLDLEVRDLGGDPYFVVNGLRLTEGPIVTTGLTASRAATDRSGISGLAPILTNLAGITSTPLVFRAAERREVPSGAAPLGWTQEFGVASRPGGQQAVDQVFAARALTLKIKSIRDDLFAELSRGTGSDAFTTWLPGLGASFPTPDGGRP